MTAVIAATLAAQPQPLPGLGPALPPGSVGQVPGASSMPSGALRTGLPHDIRAALVVPPPWWQLVLLAAVAAGLLAAGFALWRWHKRRRSLRPAPARDPWEELESRLRLTEPAEPFTKVAQEQFFFEISLILREAIERRTQVPATDRTCQELRGPLRSKLPLTPSEVEDVLHFLERADVIKFAKAPTDTAEAVTARARVGRWVHALIPPSTETSIAGVQNAAR